MASSALLKQPVDLAGTVTRFRGNGRKLGYPTANIESQTQLTDGVYFGFADLADYAVRPAIIFVGTPTTVGDTERRVEAHLPGIVDQDYYGAALKLTIYYYHRPNETFGSIDELLLAMRADELAAEAWFASWLPASDTK